MSEQVHTPGGFPPLQPPAAPPSQPQKTRTSLLALFAFLLGLVSLGAWIFTAIPAVVLALLAFSTLGKNPQLRGTGLAVMGVLLSAAGFFIAPMMWLMMIGLLVGPSHGDLDHLVEEPGRERIVHFHLTGAMTETPHMEVAGMMGGSPRSFTGLIKRLKKAGEDDSVQAVVLTVDRLSLGFAHIEELRTALTALKENNKKVFAHSEGMRTGGYALLSGVSHLNLVPTASLMLTGLHAEALFLKDGLSKIGVEADIIHIGDYKSAGETLARNEPSEEAKANMNWLLDGLYGSTVDMIAESRSMSPERVKEVIDQGLYTAQGALAAGLVDSVMHKDEFLDFIKKTYGEDIFIDNYYGRRRGMDLDSPFLPLTLMLSMSAPPPVPDKDAVALIHVAGAIMTGHSQPSPFGDMSGAYSGDIAKALNTAAKDDSIKAVVLRVDSPGGSATASDIILRAAHKVKEKKPLIVSMGNVAASGGYYVACNATTIFADETTITGSIGVVGGKIVTAEMWKKLGVNWHAYDRGANANILSGSQRFDEGQRTLLGEHMTDVYTTFKDHVVKGRGSKLTKGIDEIAGGRVFTGKQALELGLVDEIGGLAEAIEHVKKLVNDEDLAVRVLPAPKPIGQLILEDFFGSSNNSSDLEVRGGHGEGTKQALARLGTQTAAASSVMTLLEKLDPPHMQAARQALAAAQLLQDEEVIMMMPQLLVFP